MKIKQRTRHTDDRQHDVVNISLLTFSLDERCDVKIGGFGLMENGRNTRLESRSPDEQRGKLSVRWMAKESITDSIFTSMTDMVRAYSHSDQNYCAYEHFLLFLKKIGGHQSLL